MSKKRKEEATVIRTSRLIEELLDAGLPVVGCAVVAAQHATSGIVTWHVRPEGTVRVDWAVVPSASLESMAATVIAAHQGEPTLEEKLDGTSQRQRVLAALAIRASASWAGLSAANKNRVQTVIGNAAQALITLLS